MAREAEEAIRRQASLLREVRRLAAEEGTSVARFVNVAVAEKVAALRTARTFEERAARADIPAAIDVLRHMGRGRPPVPGDGLDAPAEAGEIIRAG